MQTEITKKRFTVEENYKMDEAGVLSPEDRTFGDSHAFPDTPFSAQELPA